MASRRQILANRSNAQKSTGPRTAKGKARSRQNAQKHGLNTAVVAGSKEALEIERLSSLLVEGDDGNPFVVEASRRAGASEALMARARGLKQSVYQQLFPTPGLNKPGKFASLSSRKTQGFVEDERAALIDQLRVLERYERRAFSRRLQALRDLDQEKSALEVPDKKGR